MFGVIAALVSLSALFSFINYKWLRWPKTIGLMFLALITSLSLMMSTLLGFTFAYDITSFVAEINFGETVLNVILCFLLFAGALHIDISRFLEQKWAIGVLATLGVIFSMLVVGIELYVLYPLIGIPLTLSVCFLFGALISPTDPVAVLALLKESKVTGSVKMKVAGESLLNDGVGVVLFLAILGFIEVGAMPSFTRISTLLLQEIAGGIFFGIAIGFIACELLRRVDDYQVEILISLALVVGGYALAQYIHISGPLAIVAAGLVVGNRGRKYAMSEKTRGNLDIFWDLIDDILNASLFVLVGLEALLLNVKGIYIAAGLLTIPLVLFGRFISVWLSAKIAGFAKPFSKGSITILTWGGLRGGISFALALALPHGEARDVLLLAVYIVVVFSILVQGLSMNSLLRRLGV